ncbi:MAG: prolyl-tRNA synthetase associated domain-containing protein [bacterium]
MNNHELLELLKELKISFKRYSHPPIHNVADGEKYAKDIGGTRCKNLFLRDTQNRLYLIVTLEKKRVNLKDMALQIGTKHLSFASSAALKETLNIKPRCVTPLALINDTDKRVVALFDKDILNEKELSFHPLVNTETVTITLEDTLKFIDYCGHKWIAIDNFNDNCSK